MNHSTVLIVEDDCSLREAVCDTLDLAGYPVTFAKDGNTALNMMAEEDIGMVISDVQMKPMTCLRKYGLNDLISRCC